MICYILALNFFFVVWAWTTSTTNRVYKRDKNRRNNGFLQPLRVDGRPNDLYLPRRNKKGLFVFGSSIKADIPTNTKDHKNNNDGLLSTLKTKNIHKDDHPNMQQPQPKKFNNETSNLIEFATYCLIDASPAIHQLGNHTFDTRNTKNNTARAMKHSFPQKSPSIVPHSTTSTLTKGSSSQSSQLKRNDKNGIQNTGINRIIFPRFYPNLFLSRLHLSAIRKTKGSTKQNLVQQQSEQDNYFQYKVIGTLSTVSNATSSVKDFMFSNLRRRNEISNKIVGEGTKLLEKVKSTTASVTDTAQDAIELSTKLVQVVATDALVVVKSKKDETIKYLFHSTPEMEELVSWVETQSNKVGTGLSKQLHYDRNGNIFDRKERTSIRNKIEENDKGKLQKVPIVTALIIILKDKLADIMAFMWVQIIRLVMKFGLEDELLLMLPIKVLIKVLNICLQRKCRPGIIRVVSVELDRRVRKTIATNIDNLTDPLEDATKATLQKITGKDTYQFGDITRSVLKNLRVQETIAKSTNQIMSIQATRDMKQYIEQIVDELQYVEKLRQTVNITTTPLRRKITGIRIPLIPFVRLSKS